MPPARTPKGNKQSPSDELRNLLLLNNNLPIFAEIKKNIFLIAKEFLDIKKRPGQQNEAIEAMMKELADRYPDLFDAEDKHRRLKLALKIIRQRHARMRLSAKRKLPRTTHKTSRHTSARLSAHLNPSSVKEMKVESEIATPDPTLAGRDESPGYRDFLIPTNFSEPSSSSQPNSQAAINRRPPATPLRRRATPGILNGNARAPIQRMVPLTPQSSVSTPASPRTPTARRPVPNASGEEHPLQGSAGAEAQPRRQISSVPPSPRAFRANEPEETDAVYTFLAGCVPSMDHLFEGFIDYGCQNEEFLLGISSWPPELISNLIRKVAVKCGEYVSDMDVDVLQARFLTYFTAR